MLRFDKVSKVYRTGRGEVTSLDRLDLHVKAGEFVAIRGPSGCGKTTLLLAAGGMLRPTSGTVLLGGKDLYRLRNRQRAALRAQTIGFVFQMFHLIPYLTVRENVLLAGSSRDGKQAGDRAKELLDQLGLSSRSHHTPAQLSTGERQRVALARALFHRPRIILADEPTGNLDPANSEEVFRHLHTFHESGGTVLVVTHGPGPEAYADRTVQLAAGQLALSGT